MGGNSENGNNSRLTNKQLAFIEEYFVDFNGTRAAKRAGYKGNDNVLATVASENLRKPKIAEKIAERFFVKVMTADEVLARLSEMARADIADFIGEAGAIDWQKVKAKGYLIKKVVHRKGQQSLIELHDSQSALAHIGKYYRLFVESHVIKGEVEHTFPQFDDALERAYGDDDA